MAAPWHTRFPAARRTAGLLLAVVLGVATAACGAAEGTAPGGPTSGPPEASSTAPPSPAPSAFSPSASAQEPVEEDIDAAVTVVNRYWSDHWDDQFTGTYRPPKILRGYDGEAARVPACAGEPLADDNAVYCTAADFLAWDVDLMNAGHRAGDAWVYLVIAHEWGHAIQNRINSDLVAQELELQADCLAGAVLFGAAEDGGLRFESGDTEELTQALSALADDTPWTKATDHGNATERIGAFERGAEGGVQGCIPR
ncbi:neutral zinc metallopeptidase [Streptomyces sp. NPDC048639]|uniref:neutral zinc metallopeptidase n=1 Tax=Streptomyces sp. NPDC048639 TaxID=3365581 RepID=UPI0037201EB6